MLVNFCAISAATDTLLNSSADDDAGDDSDDADEQESEDGENGDDDVDE